MSILRTAHIPFFQEAESIGCSSAELERSVTRPAFTDDVIDRVENVITSLTCQSKCIAHLSNAADGSRDQWTFNLLHKYVLFKYPVN
jgi:hypothetical protein